MNRNPVNPDSDRAAAQPKPRPQMPVAAALQITIVARRFWPLATAAEYAVTDLATSLKRQGHDVRIVTIRWEKHWPADFDIHEVPVHRMIRPATAPWGTFRYLRNLNQYITDQQPDALIVFGLSEEAWSITKFFADRIPVVLRIDNHLLGTAEKANLNQRQLAALRAASQLFVESSWTRERILQQVATDSSFASSLAAKTQLISSFVSPPSDQLRTLTEQAAARASLANAHPMLEVDPTAPLVICGCPLNGDGGVADLVNAWSDVANRFPRARLWILGEGRKSRRVWDHILRRQLVRSVIIPGAFDDIERPFQAADLFVHPMRAAERCGFLDYAMAAGLCPLVTRTAGTSQVVAGVNGLVVPPSSPAELASQIIEALDDSNLRDRLGRAAMKSMRALYDKEAPVERVVAALKPSTTSAEHNFPQPL